MRSFAWKVVRLLRRISLVLLCLLALNFVASRFSNGDFRGMHAGSRFPTLAWMIGKRNFALVLNRSGPMFWIGGELKGNCMPLVRTGSHCEVFVALLAERWTKGTRMQYGGIPYVIRSMYSVQEDDAGNSASWHLWFTDWTKAAIWTGFLPACQLLGIGWRKIGRLRRNRLAAKLRNWRSRMTLCVCGYDLRETKSRCPECGRKVRWLPVSVDRRKRRISRVGISPTA